MREELEDEPKVPAADAIREARSQLKEPARLARFRIAKDASVWWALGCPTRTLRQGRRGNRTGLLG